MRSVWAWVLGGLLLALLAGLGPVQANPLPDPIYYRAYDGWWAIYCEIIPLVLEALALALLFKLKPFNAVLLSIVANLASGVVSLTWQPSAAWLIGPTQQIPLAFIALYAAMAVFIETPLYYLGLSRLRKTGWRVLLIIIVMNIVSYTIYYYAYTQAMQATSTEMVETWSSFGHGIPVPQSLPMSHK